MNVKQSLGNLNWLFFLLAIVALVAGLFYLPPLLKVVNSAIIASLALVVFYNTVRTLRANANLAAEKHRLASIIANLRDGILVYDENFKILTFNRAAEQIFNVSAEDIVGKSFTLKVKEEKSPLLRPLLTVLFPALAPAIIRRSEPGAYPQVMDISLNDPPLELRVSTERMFGDEGKVTGFIKIIHDRTRELALLRSKSEFITVASHQLRTPLTATNWALQSLAEEPLAESQKNLVLTASGSVNRLLKIVNDLLDVAKIEEGRFGYQFQEIDLTGFLENALKQTMPVAERYRVKLYFEKPGVPIMATVDAQKLGMAISNLLDNAIKYNIPNGEVIVKLEQLSGKPYAEISVRDTGIGIPSEEMQKVFTRFFRAENAAKASVEGTGLGLYIARNIIRRHGGEMNVESQLNRGSAFSFTLPTNPALIPPKEFIYEE